MEASGPEFCSRTSILSRTLKCILCRSPRGDTSPEKVVFNQFCAKFLPLETCDLWRDNASRSGGSRSVCSNCSESMSTAVDTKSRMEVVEGRVRKLQEEVVQELRELQIYVDLLGWQLGRIEGRVKEGEDPGDEGRRSQTGLLSLPSSGNASENGGADDDAGVGRGQDDGDNLLRKCIGKVTNDLRTFRNRLKRRVSCGAGATAEDIEMKPSAKRVRVGGNLNQATMEMEDADLDPEHDIGDSCEGDNDDIDDSDISDANSEHLPQIQSCTSTNRRTLLIKRIKLEPSAVAPESDCENGENVGDTDNDDADENETINACDNVPISSHSGGDPRLESFLKEQRAFHQKFLQSQEDLIREQLELKAHVLRMLSTSHMDGLQGPHSDSLFSIFPIKSSEDLERVEDMLEDHENQERLISTLSRFGRTEISKTAGDVMRYLLEVKFSREVRLTNSSGKIPFGEKRLCECVRVALTKNHPEVKMNDVNTKIASWLRGSIDRGGGRRERHGNGNVTVNNEEDESSQQHQEDQ